MGGDPGSRDPPDGESGAGCDQEEHCWLAAGEPGDVVEHALRTARREPLCELLDLGLRVVQVPGQRPCVAGAPFTERADLPSQRAQCGRGASLCSRARPRSSS